MSSSQQQQPPRQQQYCLRWNNHRTNLLSVFDELLQNEAFTDVVLACEDGKLRCHRIVLAACSPYFQSLLTDLPCKHPIIVLKDVRLEDMRAILEYMYRGEVNVAQDQLADLLKVAESLKVKGLVEEKGCRPPPPVTNIPEPMERVISPPSPPSPPHISTSTPNNPVNSSSSASPPHFKSHHSSYVYKGFGTPNSTGRPMPVWPHMSLPPSQSPHSYDAADMSPLKRKKISSFSMHKDTPILRTVLGQGQPDSSQQPVSLVCRPDSRGSIINGSELDKLHPKNEPSEDAQSTYTDFSEESSKEVKLGVSSSSPQALSNIATYVPAHNREWNKRYKQYTRNDIMAAIDEVRNGHSALQAAKKYGVPSRTLYDKVKKLGITTHRPFKRGANGSACFPYAHFGDQELPDGALNNNSQASAFLEATTLLQHALDNSGEEKREALIAIAAAAAAAHEHHHTPSSPKFHHSPEGSSGPGGGYHSSDAEDHIQDLSVHRHQVIVANPDTVKVEAD